MGGISTWHRRHRGDVGRGHREDTDTGGTRGHRGNMEGDAEGTRHEMDWDHVVADKPSLESQVGD